MALKKDIEISNTGVIGNYIRIGGVNLAVAQRVLQVKLDIYLSRAVRKAGKDALSSIVVDLPMNIVLEGTLLKAVYIELKKIEQLSGAADV